MASQKDPDNSPLVISELLCYVTGNLKRSTSEQLVSAIYRFYDIEEIIMAKKILYEKYPELGEYPARKTSINRSEQEAHSTDIVESLVHLDSLELETVFVAKNLKRIPKWDPHDSDHLSILEKISKLEGRLHNTEFVVSENKAHILKLNDDVSKFDNRFESCEKAVAGLAAKDSVLNTPYLDALKNGKDKPSCHPNIKTPAIEHIEPRGPPNPPKILANTKGTGGRSGATGDGGAIGKKNKDISDEENVDADEDEYVIPREQRRKQERRRRSFITGTSGNARFRGGPPPVRDYFVYRVMKTTQETDIEECLSDNDIKYELVKKISKEEAKYSSFKISVSLNDIGKVMDPNVWPEGVRIRRFFTFSNKQNGE